MKRWFTRGKKDDKCRCGPMCSCHRHRTCGGVYGLGFIGAAIYYISNAASFWVGVIGVLKAVVWPAFLVYQALKYFGG